MDRRYGVVSTFSEVTADFGENGEPHAESGNPSVRAVCILLMKRGRHAVHGDRRIENDLVAQMCFGEQLHWHVKLKLGQVDPGNPVPMAFVRLNKLSSETKVLCCDRHCLF